MMKKQQFIKYVLWFTLLSVMVIIFYFSHQNGSGSQKTSDGLLDLLISRLPVSVATFIDDYLTDDFLSVLIRKFAHFSLYFALGSIAYMLAFVYFPKKKKLNILYAELFSFFYALTDELHQHFIPGRAAKITDCLIDSMGSITGIVIIFFCFKKFFKEKEKNS